MNKLIIVLGLVLLVVLMMGCEFTHERTSIESRTLIDQSCSVNGVEVNCSEFKDRFPDYEHYVNYDTGNYELNGVCPGWDDNMSVSECIKDIEEDLSQMDEQQELDDKRRYDEMEERATKKR